MRLGFKGVCMEVGCWGWVDNEEVLYDLPVCRLLVTFQVA
jgi:hypothetical protein